MTKWLGLSATTSHIHAFRQVSRCELLPAEPVANIAAELLKTHDLLSALAGPAVAITMETEGGARSVYLPAADLTHILVNLVKNAVEAMPTGGGIRICLHEQTDNDCEWLTLTVEDGGLGIPADALEKVFISGYSAHANGTNLLSLTPTHRGLGLTVCRSIVEAAGGHIHAENRTEGGARIVIELPIWNE